MWAGFLLLEAGLVAAFGPLTAVVAGACLLAYGYSDRPEVRRALGPLLGWRGLAFGIVLTVSAAAGEKWWHQPQEPLFQLHTELRLQNAHDLCGYGDCYYRIDLDGAGLLVVDDVATGRIRFNTFKGPFVSAANMPDLLEKIRPDDPIHYRSRAEWPWIETVVSPEGTTLTYFGEQLGSVQFDLFGSRVQVVKASNRTFQITLTSFRSEPVVSGENQFVFSFSVRERR